MSTPLWAWAATIGLIVGVVAFDLLVLHRRPRHVGYGEAALWSGVWVGMATFLLAGMMDRFSLLRAGLAGVLVFVGLKMVAADVVHVPIAVSLAVIVSIIGVSLIASLQRRPASPERRLEGAADEARA